MSNYWTALVIPAEKSNAVHRRGMWYGCFYALAATASSSVKCFSICLSTADAWLYLQSSKLSSFYKSLVLKMPCFEINSVLLVHRGLRKEGLLTQLRDLYYQNFKIPSPIYKVDCYLHHGYCSSKVMVLVCFCCRKKYNLPCFSS